MRDHHHPRGSTPSRRHLSVVRSPRHRQAAGVVLAGGEGRRLMPLTLRRSKPAIRFGGSRHLLDFPLSNLLNGGVGHVLVLGRRRGDDVARLVSGSWAPPPGHSPQTRIELRTGLYPGSADALHRNLDAPVLAGADDLVVFGADQVTRLDPSALLAFHRATGASLTIAAVRVPIARASAFGVIRPGPGGSIAGFEEKPPAPCGLPDAPHLALVSAGIYAFDAGALAWALRLDARDESSRHDIGGDLVPRLVAADAAAVYDLARNPAPGQPPWEQGYWRDVGTVDAYYDAHMDLVAAEPRFRLEDPRWPILPHHPGRNQPPERPRPATEGAEILRSVLADDVVVEPGASVRDAVLLDGVRVGRGATVRSAVLGEQVSVPAGAVIVPGDPPGLPAATTPGGVVVVTIDGPSPGGPAAQRPAPRRRTAPSIVGPAATPLPGGAA